MNDRRSVLLITRLIWGALLLSELVIIGVIGGIVAQGGAIGRAGWLFPGLGVGVAVISLALAYGVRGAIYKAHWRGEAITPWGYFQGNVVFMASLEGAVIINMVLLIFDGAILVHLAMAALCVAGHVLSFPNGRAMAAAQPDFGAPEMGKR